MFIITSISAATIIIIATVPAIRSYFITGVFDKIKSYLFVNSSQIESYSANDRTQQLAHSWEYFWNSNTFQYLAGHGTGGYSQYVSGATQLISDAQEAYNLYLSTLTDRGVLGLVIIIFIFIFANKFRVKGNLYSNTIFFGILMQAAHWMVTGNFWLYYFWFEIILLIGFNRNVYRHPDNSTVND